LGVQGLEPLLDLRMHVPVSTHRFALITRAEADCDVVSFFDRAKVGGHANPHIVAAATLPQVRVPGQVCPAHV